MGGAYLSKCPMVYIMMHSQGFPPALFFAVQNLLMKNIHLHGIGSAILPSSTKWIIKCCWPSEIDVGNCISNNVMTTWDSSFMISISLVFIFLWKSVVPSLTIYRWPLVLIQSWDLEPLLDSKNVVWCRSCVILTLKLCQV